MSAPRIAIGLGVAAVLAPGFLFLPQILVRERSEAPVAAAAIDRGAVEAIVRDYLLDNPELLREMAAALQDRDRVAQSAQLEQVFEKMGEQIFNSPNQTVLGNPDGDVTLVEFFDYNCGYCKSALDDMNALLEKDPQLRIVLKEFPLLSQGSADAALVSAAVHTTQPERYLEFHRALLAESGAIDGGRALQVASGLGLDTAKIEAALSTPEVEAFLREGHTLARALGITGTPSYVIGKEVIPGAVGIETLTEAIANVRECGATSCG